MPARPVTTKPVLKPAPPPQKVTAQAVYNALAANPLAANRAVESLFPGLLGGRNLDGDCRDYDRQFRYPRPSVDNYHLMYEREGVGTRVVEVYPDECWKSYPQIYETEEARVTKWERAVARFTNPHSEFNLCHWMHRLDVRSGIDHYGVAVLGLTDLKSNENWEKPVPGVDKNGEKKGNTQNDLNFVRVFPERLARIDSYETDKSSRRYGRPLYYTVRFTDPNQIEDGAYGSSSEPSYIETRVHWTRVVHAADNRGVSEVFGTPRMRPVWNRLCDIRKVAGGSAEMFWKGAFPGMKFTAFPDATDDDIEGANALRQDIRSYQEGLQRYLLSVGGEWESLAPQVADPSAHLTQLLMLVCQAMRVPFRIFMGSEAGHLASTQDAQTWNNRLAGRQQLYLTPFLIEPFLRRLMVCGVVPWVDDYVVSWSDLNSLSDAERADVALKNTQAVLQYVQSGMWMLMKPTRYFVTVMKMPESLAKATVADAGGEEAILRALKENHVLTNAGPTGTDPTKPGGAAKKRNSLGGTGRA